MHVIESDDYRREVEALKGSALIRQLAEDVRGLSAEERETWAFVSAASREYNRRGGTLARSIGGPARAINALIAEGRI